MANTSADTSSMGANLGDRAAAEADNLRDRAAEAGKQAMRAADAGRERAGSGLETAADKLHDAAEKLPGGERVRGAAHKTADALGATGRYVSRHGVGDMLDDAADFIKAHPTQALVGALVIGFFVGRGMRRD